MSSQQQPKKKKTKMEKQVPVDKQNQPSGLVVLAMYVSNWYNIEHINGN